MINQGTGQCLDDRDGKTSDWSPVQQWTCNDTSTTMLWALGSFQNGAAQLLNLRAIQNGGSTCLDVAHGSVDDGGVLQLYDCMDGDAAQHLLRARPTDPGQVQSWPRRGDGRGQDWTAVAPAGIALHRGLQESRRESRRPAGR